MKATLILDDDVAAQLERTRRQRGRSLKDLGNELLRRALSLLSTVPTTQPNATPLDAQIDQLYDEIRDLVVRSAENLDLEAEIESKRMQLHALQVEEAEAWMQQAEARRHLKPGEGYRLLERAERLLDR